MRKIDRLNELSEVALTTAGAIVAGGLVGGVLGHYARKWRDKRHMKRAIAKAAAPPTSSASPSKKKAPARKPASKKSPSNFAADFIDRNKTPKPTRNKYGGLIDPSKPSPATIRKPYRPPTPAERERILAAHKEHSRKPYRPYPPLSPDAPKVTLKKSSAKSKRVPEDLTRRRQITSVDTARAINLRRQVKEIHNQINGLTSKGTQKVKDIEALQVRLDGIRKELEMLANK